MPHIDHVAVILRGGESRNVVCFRVNDDHVVFLPSKAHQQLLAVCLYCVKHDVRAVGLKELVGEKQAWPFGLPKFANETQMMRAFQNNLQREFPTLRLHLHLGKGDGSHDSAFLEVECEFALLTVP